VTGMTDWLEHPQEWRAIPREEHKPRGVLKALLDWIVDQGGAGKRYLLKHARMSEKHRCRSRRTTIGVRMARMGSRSRCGNCQGM